jgi:hypothetical protein
MVFFSDDELDEQECLRLLGRTQLGRIVVSLRALPIVLPVRYELTDGNLLFVVSDDKVWRGLNGCIVTLHAEGVEEDKGRRWSVNAIGAVEHDPSRAFDQTSPGEVFRLKPKILSGRWIETI